MKKLMLALVVMMILVPMTTVMARNPKHGRDWSPWDRYDDSYIALKFGVFMPNEDTGFLENGYAVGGALGHKFNRNFALEFGVDYTVADIDDGYGYEDSYAATLGIPVTAKVIVPLSDQVDLFAGAGLGIYSTHFEFDHGYDEYYDDNMDDTSPGFHALLGADVKVNPFTALTMEVKYTEIDHDLNDDYHEDLEFGGTTASLGLKFLF